MPTYRYRAYDGSGREIAGQLDAIGHKDALQRLRKDGLYPSEVAESTAGSKARKKVSSWELAITTRQLGTLLASGATLTEALGVLSEEEGNHRLRSIISKVKDDITEGASLAAAIEDYPDVFSGIYRGMISAGEASGSLDVVLSRLADYLESRAKIMQEVRSAMVYPSLMVLVSFGVLSFLFIFVIPKITRIFEDTRNSLPLITTVLLWLVDIVRGYWPVITLSMVAVVFGVRQYLRRPGGKVVLDRVSLKIPWFGRLVTHFHIANMTRTLGTLLKGGLPMLKALELTKKVLNNSVFDEILDKAKEDVMGGTSLSVSLKGFALIPPIVVHMIIVGERGGNIDDMLLKASDTYGQEVETGIKRALSLMEPLMIIVMGVVVGFIVLAILLPIFQLNQVMR